jgi:hypothetical protein
MPYKDSEKRKECKKRWAEKNKEKINQRGREKYQRDKEKILQQQKQYYQTEKGKKVWRINNWKNKLKIKCDNFDKLYDRYINTEHCELCNIKLTEDKIRKPTTRCLDHDHQTRLVRNIVCQSCNVRREVIYDRKEYMKLYMREQRYFKKYSNVIAEFINDINEY